MTIMKIVQATIAASLVIGPALAEPPYPYAGGLLGFGEAEFAPTLNPPFPSFDETDATMAFVKGFGGYRITDFFAVEASLVGAANDEDDLEPEVTFGAISGTVLGILPINDMFELFGRFGAFFGESEVEFPGELFSDSEDETGVVWGGGLLFSLGDRKQFTVRGEFESYETDELDDLWSVGAGFQYNFGGRGWDTR